MSDWKCFRSSLESDSEDENIYIEGLTPVDKDDERYFMPGGKCESLEVYVDMKGAPGPPK